jgi:mannose-6-phosphate isomerase-like protein (cupin superfamily)
MGIVHRRSGEAPYWNWENVELKSYDPNGNINCGATRQILIGWDENSPNFALRYFTIPPRGFSNLDHHEHDHGVIIMHGRARVMMGETFEEVSEGDVVYIPSWERHQFENLTDEPFSFLCIVPAREKPQVETTVTEAVQVSAEGEAK